MNIAASGLINQGIYMKIALPPRMAHVISRRFYIQWDIHKNDNRPDFKRHSIMCKTRAMIVNDRALMGRL